MLLLGVLPASFPHDFRDVQPVCDVNSSNVCDDFCNYRCDFHNETMGETGGPLNITIYCWTPKNVTGIANKDTGDVPGDVSFFLSKKNLTKQCFHDPSGFGCFLDGDNLYGKFVVSVDGHFGPYFECNPENIYEQSKVDPHNYT